MSWLPSGTMGLMSLVVIVLLAIASILVLTAPDANAKARTRKRLALLTNPSADVSIDDLDDDVSQLRRKQRRAGYFSNLLTRAGGRQALPLVVIAAVIGSVVAFAAVMFVLRPPVFVSLFGSLLGAAGAAVFMIKRLISRREQAFLSDFPDALDLIVRAVRAGIPVTETLQIVADEGGPRIAEEFSTIGEELALGVDMAATLKSAAHRIGIPDFNFFVVSLLLQRETGGGLAETLENLSNVVRRRKELRLKIRALTSEGRMSAKIVGGIPVLAIGAITVMRPEYMQPLIQDPTGRVLLAAGAGSIVLGMTLIGRITRMPQ